MGDTAVVKFRLLTSTTIKQPTPGDVGELGNHSAAGVVPDSEEWTAEIDVHGSAVHVDE